MKRRRRTPAVTVADPIASADWEPLRRAVDGALWSAGVVLSVDERHVLVDQLVDNLAGEGLAIVRRQCPP